MEKDLVIKKKTGLSNEEWYQELVEDCRAIGVERGTNARMEVIQGKWELGQRINLENDNMQRKDIYGKNIIGNLANDIGISSTDLWSCLKFYKQLGVDNFEETLPKLPEGKNVTWYKITLWMGDRQDKDQEKVKESYKLADILEVLKAWIIKKGATNEKEIEKTVTEFREALIKYKGKK